MRLNKICPLCKRNPVTCAHHIIPRSRAGAITIEICTQCHERIHTEGWRKALPEIIRYLEEYAYENNHKR